MSGLIIHPLYLTALNGTINSTTNPAGVLGFLRDWSHNTGPENGNEPNTELMNGKTNVRLQVASDPAHKDQWHISGDLPDVQTFDDFGKDLTHTKAWPDGKGKAGKVYDYELDPVNNTDVGDRSNQPARYLRLFHGGQDETCIAAIGVQSGDKSESLILGDMMGWCNWDYWESAIPIKLGNRTRDPHTGRDNTFQHKPQCFWMGGNIYPKHVWIHLPDFSGAEAAEVYSNGREFLCNSGPRLNWLTVPKNKFAPMVYDPPPKYHVPNGWGEPNQFDPKKNLDPVYWKWLLWEPKNENFWGGHHYHKHVLPPHGLHDPTWDPPVGGGNPDLSRAAKTVSPTAARADDFAPSPAPRGSRTRRSQIDFSRWNTIYGVTNSTMKRYSAIQKCSEENFVGPDWANRHEQLYCHLATRKLLPFCEQSDEEGCFDVNEETLRLPASVHEERQENMSLVSLLKGWAGLGWRQERRKGTHIKKTKRIEF